MKYSTFRWEDGKPSFIFNEGFWDLPWLPICIAWNWQNLEYYLSIKIGKKFYTRLLTKKINL